MRKIFIIVNPVAGKGKSDKYSQRLIKSLKAASIPFDCFRTTPPQNATDLVQAHLDASHTDLIIIGGDGTIHQAINGLSYRIPVGIIAGGSANDYVKSLQLPKSIKAQIRIAISGTIRQVDLGRCNGKKFMNGIGIGFDGQIVAALQQQSRLSGATKYYYQVLKILGTFTAKTFRTKIDARSSEQKLILFCIAKGTTFGGGFRLTPQAQLSDGYLHTCQIGDMSPQRRFLQIRRLQNGTHHQLKEIQMGRACELYIAENPELHAHADGEYIGQPPFYIHILPAELSIRVAPPTTS